jgi:uncharacterized OB-fold protein
MTSLPFWDGCARGELLYQRCQDCAQPIFDPAPMCRWCNSTSLVWQPSAGLGAVYSWTVAWRPQSPAFHTPYCPAIIDMDEGYQILSNLIDCDVDDVHVGMGVQVAFQSFGPMTLPYFRPVDENDRS